MNLLDHGRIELLDAMGNDLDIVNAARVSYAKFSEKFSDNDEKLLRYLWKNGHTSPFEQSVAKFRVKAPIFVFRQWQRHRTQSYNEVSARYTELPEEFYVPEPSQITEQSKANKQQRTDVAIPAAAMLAEMIRYSCNESFITYRKLLEEGTPRELARCVLPVSTYSEMIVTANILNWLKFISLRSHPHAQYEIRVYSDAILKLLRGIFPATCRIFSEK